MEGYKFLLFARKFGNKYGKKIMDIAIKTEIDAKNASKRVVQKIIEATEDLMGHNIGDRITSVPKKKVKKKKTKQIKDKKFTYHQKGNSK